VDSAEHNRTSKLHRCIVLFWQLNEDSYDIARVGKATNEFTVSVAKFLERPSGDGRITFRWRGREMV
jgi:hypothetical protein